MRARQMNDRRDLKFRLPTTIRHHRNCANEIFCSSAVMCGHGYVQLWQHHAIGSTCEYFLRGPGKKRMMVL